MEYTVIAESSGDSLHPITAQLVGAVSALGSRGGEQKQKFRVGDVISDATVAFHHKDGVLFQLTAKQKGMYFLSKMQPLQAETRD